MSPVITVGFNLPQGVTISASEVDAVSYQPTNGDNDPADTLAGAASVNTQPVTIIGSNGIPVTFAAGKAVMQQVQGGVAGVTYVYRFKITRTDNIPDEEDVKQSVVVYLPNC